MRGHIPPGRFIFLCLIMFVISGCSVQRPDTPFDSPGSSGKEQPKNSTAQLPPAEKEPVKVDYLTVLSDIVSPEIYVYKEKRRLYVIQSNVLVRDYPIGLGLHPVGDKRNRGDGRTPEGNFFICSRTIGAPSDKALILDYPDKTHAQRALFTGIISPLQFKEILLSAEYKATPPLDTKLGGELSIHAGGAQTDWTHGDIALYNSDMNELYKIASIGTPVHIRP